MLQLQEDIKKFASKKIKVVVVCPERVGAVEKFKAINDTTFDMVSDHTHQLAKEYGQQFKLLKLGRMPAQLLIDKSGALIFKHYAQSMKDIVENQEILKLV